MKSLKLSLSFVPIILTQFLLIIFLSGTGNCYGQILKMYPLEDFDCDFIMQLNHHRTGMGMSALQRSNELDDAAKHHAMYLALHYEKYGRFGNHKESVDIANFTEFYNCWDRPGNPVAEVIDHAVFYFEHKNHSVEEILSAAPPSLKYLKSNPRTMFMCDYLSSPPHRDILQSDFKLNQVGTCCMMALLLPEDPIYAGYIKCYLFNVTTFK